MWLYPRCGYAPHSPTCTVSLLRPSNVLIKKVQDEETMLSGFKNITVIPLLFLRFPFVGVRLVNWSLLCALLLCLSQISLPQSDHRSCGLPSILRPSCMFVSDLFGNLSSFILTTCPAHFIRLLTIWPTIQVPTSSIHLLSHTCSLCLCNSDRANFSKP